MAVIKAFKKLTEEAKKAGKAIQDDGLDAIPGARAVLRFIENQGEQLQKEQNKLMKKVDLSKITRQFEDLAVNSPDEIRKMAEIAETVEAAAKLAFQGGRMVAVLIGQRVVGFKDWTK